MGEHSFAGVGKRAKAHRLDGAHTKVSVLQLGFLIGGVLAKRDELQYGLKYEGKTAEEELSSNGFVFAHRSVQVVWTRGFC